MFREAGNDMIDKTLAHLVNQAFTKVSCIMYILLAVLECSIAEYFNESKYKHREKIYSVTTHQKF